MNHATYCEPIAVRADGESVPDFKSRARAILAERGGGCIAWGAPEEVEWVDAEPEIVILKGGSEPDASGDFASLGDVLIERANGESIREFSDPGA